MEENNIAAMRDACQKMRDLLMFRGDGKSRCILTWDEFNESQKMLCAVLAAPPRNCDIGSPEEQSDRFANLCDSHSGCSQCPVQSLWNFDNGHKPSCGVLWAQMPYEKGETDGRK